MPFDVMNYREYKTVKLSDAYVVEILDKYQNGKTRKFKIYGQETKEVIDNSTSEVEGIFHNAISVKIPNVKMTSETLKYNIFSHTFARLDLDAEPEPLTITLYETSDNKVKSFMTYLLERTGLNENYYGRYKPFDSVSELNIYILDNDLTYKMFRYHFEELKLVNYDYGYSYDYKDSSLPTMELSFAYEHFSFENLFEPVISERTMESENLQKK